MVTPENPHRRDFWQYFMRELPELSLCLEHGNEELEIESEPKWSNERLTKRIMLDISDEANWPAAIAWFAEWSPKNEVALEKAGAL